MAKPKASNGRKTTKRRSKGRPSSRGRTSRLGWLFGSWWFRFLLVTGVMVGVAVCVVYSIWAGFYDLKELKAVPQSTVVYDFQGKPFSRLAGENRITVSIDEVSPHFIEALLVREDSRFYKHFGVDPIGIARAVVKNMVHLSTKEGASTLTQQLARNSFSLGGRNLHRKVLEAFVAVRIEANLSKKEILESYVNRIYFGSGCWGVETASRTYFGKASRDLTLSEAAILAGLIRSPNRFSPFRNPKGALVQRDTVLGRMQQLGYITPEEEQGALADELVVTAKRPPGAQQSYAVEWIEQELSLLLEDDQLAQGGLQVYSTLDPQLQQVAQEALDEELTRIEKRPGFPHPKREGFTLDETKSSTPTPYLQGAVFAVDNGTGGIRAVVGGRSYRESRFNRALLSHRQVGSTFKPLVYATAYGRKVLGPSTSISDGPLRRGEIRDAPNWRPSNSDGTFGGMRAAAEGLIFSRNTMSVRVGNLAGLENVCRLGEMVGLSKLPRFPSVYLGSFDATLREMTTAYTAFPNRGVLRETFLINEVRAADGRLLYRNRTGQRRVMEAQVANTVTSALSEAVKRGTGKGVRLPAGVAGKTGTTNDYRDAWFIGYSARVTCGVWVGLDKPQQIMPRGYGATLALPVWARVMESAAKGSEPEVRRAEPVKDEPPQKQGVLRSFKRFFEGGDE